MARTVASLPAGSRITDYISLGVLTKTFPLDKVMAVVAAAGKTNQRQRDLPAHVVVYYVNVTGVIVSGGNLGGLNACPTYTLYFAHDTQSVPAQNLQNIFIRIPALHQAAHQVGDLPNILHAFREQIVGSVEIRTQAHVIHARHLHSVIEVIEQAAQRQASQLGDALLVDGVHGRTQLVAVAEFGRLGFARVLLRLLVFQCAQPVREAAVQEAFEIIDVDHAAVLGQGTQHVVGHVARHIGQGAAGGVRDDHRRG